MYDEFIEQLANAGKEFLHVALGADGPVRIISHFDTDGLCAASIFERALERENIPYKTTFVQAITTDVFEAITQEVVVFLDVGAAKLATIKEKLSSKTVYVLDHHAPVEEVAGSNHYNPFTANITERNAISGAGVAYFFALGMNPENRALAYLGVLGAIGDTQERNGFTELNNRILQHAIIQKSIKVGKRIKLFGLTSRPLVKVLEYSSDIDIPGVTGSKEGVERFLESLGIQYEWRGRLKKWYHLRSFEQDRLTNKILALKKDVPVDELLVPTYFLTNDLFRREVQDLKEFATIINACGRLESYAIALLALRADPIGQEQALMQLRVYKSAIREALALVDSLRENKELIETDSYVIINFKDKLRSSLAGIIASILARNKIYRAGVVVCTLARVGEKTKISLRLHKDSSGVQLQYILQTTAALFGADAGGHDHAAGAVIATKDEEAFLKKLQEAL